MFPDTWREAALAPPTAWGSPLATGVMRASPEDFTVDEILGFEAAGAGPHALLRVRKRGANTEWVARELARAAGCKPFEVGFAGLKDRHAVTTQHFTVPRGKRAAQDFLALRGEGYEVLSSVEHQRKLPRGALEGNRFEITVRSFHCEPATLERRIAAVRAGGVPNYFGEQRFGRDGGNLTAVWREAERLGAQADAAEAADPRAPGGRGAARDSRSRGRGNDDRGFMLSAARSLVFNAILAARVRDGSWNQLAPGDVANLDGRGSVFAVDGADPTLTVRCASLEIHATAPLLGDGESLALGTVLELEQSVSQRFPEALAVIRAARMNSERRALRIRVRDLEHHYAGDTLTLRFALSAGSFATTVLREIMAGASGD
ncbi:MAG TPA: tRNA pseudouridine(13) synthase TruD [Steroidobacteraceae bacterium]|nr:tRNA pseudouridine(13) synthase TruD [Steroidobacteraceae bacterium]